MKAEELELQLKKLSLEYLKNIDQKIKNSTNYKRLGDDPNGTYTENFEINLNNKYGFIFSIENSELYKLIKEIYFKLMEKSVEENYYFFGCNLDVAIHYYDELIKKYSNKTLGVDEIDILKEQLMYLQSDFDLIKEQNYDDAFYKDYEAPYIFDFDLAPYIVLQPVGEKDFEMHVWQNQYYKKRKYLKSKIKELKRIKYNALIKTERDESKGIIVSTSTKEKLILLEELGLIEHINQQDNNNFNASKIARILARITGENTEHLRRCINSLIREDIGDKNHPYYVQSNVDSVHAFLEKEGIRARNKKEEQQ